MYLDLEQYTGSCVCVCVCRGGGQGSGNNESMLSTFYVLSVYLKINI